MGISLNWDSSSVAKCSHFPEEMIGMTDYQQKKEYTCSVHRITFSFCSPILDGFTATCLKPEHVDLIVQAWPYSSNFTDCREWITETINLFPGVCILDSNGDPATWILQQEYGAIGMLEVVPKYRRAKLGSAATMLLAQRVCEEYYNVYSLVCVDNTASLAFHKRNRFECVKDFTVGFVNYQSKGD